MNQKNGVLILSDRAGARQQLEIGGDHHLSLRRVCHGRGAAPGIDHATRGAPSGRAFDLVIEREDITIWLDHQFDTASELGMSRGMT